MSADVKAYVSRFVVPFYFEYENGGYERLKKDYKDNISNKMNLGLPRDGKWEIASFWENYKSGNKTQAEMDIYSYLPLIFQNRDKPAESEENRDETAISNLGVSFVFKTNGKIFDLKYKISEKEIKFYCSDLGIIILRNGIGFIWFETKFKTGVSLDEYVKFQHDFKELARVNEKNFIKKTGHDKEQKEDSFCLGVWLSKIVAAKDLGIRFWAERKTILEAGNEARIPDKALLFQYLFIEQATDEERNNLAFRIANGYDEKYNAPEDIDDKLYKPFGNSCFYVSKAGMACVVKNADTNEAFFKEQFRAKYIRDYFFIYILLAYQSYSCAHYSRLLTRLPADIEFFNEPEYADKLEFLNGEINLFLIKSVFESVSNIHHQNGVYRYGKSALCIEGDIRSLTIGLNALEELVKDKRKQKEQEEKEKEKEEREERYRQIQEEKEKEKEEREKRDRQIQEEKEKEKEEREKRDGQINHALIVFGLMVVISAGIDGLNLIDWILEKNDKLNLFHIGMIILIIGLALPLIITLLRNRKKK